MGTYRHACGTCKTHAGVYNEHVLSLSLLYIQIKNIFKKVCDGIGEMVLEVKVFDNLTGFQGPMQRQEKYVQIVL